MWDSWSCFFWGEGGPCFHQIRSQKFPPMKPMAEAKFTACMMKLNAYAAESQQLCLKLSGDSWMYPDPKLPLWEIPKPYSLWVLMGKLSPRIPREDNKYHGYTIGGTPVLVPWNCCRFLVRWTNLTIFKVLPCFWYPQNIRYMVSTKGWDILG